MAALLDTETPVEGVTCGRIRDELRPVGVFQRFDGKPARPESGDLDLTAGWGHGGKGGVTMPGKGRITRRDVDGQTVLDVHVNADTCWRHIPEAVWDYTIGGYPVLKKWLSYREKPLLGRGLTPGEIRHITETSRRLAALLALHPRLDDNYRAAAASSTSPFGVR